MNNISKQLRRFLGVTLLASAGASGMASASGHFIAGLQGQYPAYDLNDSYVFASSNEGYTSFILSANPSAPGANTPPTGKVFGEGGLYNLHLSASDSTDFKVGKTLTFSFLADAVTVAVLESSNADIGEKGDVAAKGKLGEVIELPNGIRAWAGRGEEPFFGNGIGLAKFNAAKQNGQFAPELFKEDGDLFVGATASFIVVDVPNSQLGEEIKFFNTTAVEHKGDWSQVDRHANVLFPYVFLSDTPAVHEDHGQHRPELDISERRQAIVHNVFWAASVAGANPANARAHASKVADMIMPDVLTYRIGSDANYAPDQLNGRALNDDAMNTVLELMMGTAVDDHANDSHRYQKNFPYIIPKH